MIYVSWSPLRFARAGLLSSAILVSACGSVGAKRQPDNAASAIGQSEPPSSPVQESATISGEWDIVSFEGYEPARLNGTTRAAFADFGKSGVRLRIECNSSGRQGKVHRGRFLPSAENDRIQTQMGCGKEREARDERYFAFFDQSPTVELLNNGRLRLSAEGRELILERPAVRRLAYLPKLAELQGEWRLLELTRYYPQGGYGGMGLSETPGRIVVTSDSMSYTRCPQYGVRFKFTIDGRLAKKAGAELPQVPNDCKELKGVPEARDLPAPAEVLRLLHSNPMVEKSGNEAIVLSTESHAVLMTKERCESAEQSDDHRTTRIRDCASPE